MVINGKACSMGELVTFQYQCPWCKRWFETEGYRSFQPKKMPCSDCAAAYEAKVRSNFTLDEISDRVARKVGSMAACPKRKERLELWEQLSQEGELKTTLRFGLMLQVAQNIIHGIDEPMADKRGGKGGW